MEVNNDKFIKLEKDISELSEAISTISSDLKDLKTAIMGGALSQEKGIAVRLKEMEQEIEDIKKYRIENGVYMKIILGLGALVSTLVVTSIVKGWIIIGKAI